MGRVGVLMGAGVVGMQNWSEITGDYRLSRLIDISASLLNIPEINEKNLSYI